MGPIIPFIAYIWKKSFITEAQIAFMFCQGELRIRDLVVVHNQFLQKQNLRLNESIVIVFNKLENILSKGEFANYQ